MERNWPSVFTPRFCSSFFLGGLFKKRKKKKASNEKQEQALQMVTMGSD